MLQISRSLKLMAFAVLVVCMVLVVAQGIQGMHENIEKAAVRAVSSDTMDQVSSFKLLREQLRAMEKAQLNDVAHGTDTTPEIVRMAQKQLLELCEREETELTLEGILSMRGYENPVVTVHEDSVNILIKSEVVTQQESSMILELVCRETGIQSGNVKIIPIN